MIHPVICIFTILQLIIPILALDDGSSGTGMNGMDGMSTTSTSSTSIPDVDKSPRPTCCKKSNDIYIPSNETMKKIDVMERIPCDSISIEHFHQNYEQKGIPVILVDCDKDWSAKEKWTFPQLKQRFDHDSLWRVLDMPSRYDFDLITTEVEGEDLVPWSAVLTAWENKKKFYVFDNWYESLKLNESNNLLNKSTTSTSTSTTTSTSTSKSTTTNNNNNNIHHSIELEKEYQTPPFFRFDQYQHFDNYPHNYGPMRWFALGSKYTGTRPHFDPYQTDAWNSVVYGMKWWMLFPSTVQLGKDEYGNDIDGYDDDDDDEYDDDDDDDEYLGCDESCSDENISILRYFSSMWRNPPLDLLKGESIQHVFLKGGETLFIPRGMIHSVLNMEDTVGVTANYASPSNMGAIWEDLVDEIKFDKLEDVYCNHLNSDQRNQIKDFAGGGYGYSCSNSTTTTTTATSNDGIHGEHGENSEHGNNHNDDAIATPDEL